MMVLRSRGFSAKRPLIPIRDKSRKRLGHMAVSGWLGSAWLDFGWALARLKPWLRSNRADRFLAVGSGSGGRDLFGLYLAASSPDLKKAAMLGSVDDVLDVVVVSRMRWRWPRVLIDEAERMVTTARSMASWSRRWRRPEQSGTGDLGSTMFLTIWLWGKSIHESGKCPGTREKYWRTKGGCRWPPLTGKLRRTAARVDGADCTYKIRKASPT